MNITIEIAGTFAACRQDGVEALKVPVEDFLSGVARMREYSCLPEPIPDGVRFIRSRGDGTVLVVEEKPQLRTLQWLDEASPVPYGDGATYRTVRLAFPFLVIAIALRGGALTGVQQCFYRTAPLETLEDELLLPNLYNVSVNAYDQKCWLCLANLKTDLSRMSWNQKVAAIRAHIWGGGWNRSSEVHEGKSYWSAMQGVDPRVASLAAWQAASRSNPLFPLEVAWKPSGLKLGETVNAMLAKVAPPQPAPSAASLVQALRPARANSKRKLLGLF
ncbi:MAG TPA: hypothetical protein VMB03_28285 [Bryobacteraceae bacterium]|nr:hypothetical protein [Bryobacteraceae bacterium]